MIYGDAHALVYSGHKDGCVSSVKFVGHHNLTCVTVSPVDVVLKDGYPVGLLKNLQTQKLSGKLNVCSLFTPSFFHWYIRKPFNMINILTIYFFVKYKYK